MEAAMVIGVALAGLSLTLPDEAAGWRAAGPAARYDSRSIFEYIDGHGEVYLAYGMVDCLARRYTGPAGEGEVVVDVFEMQTPAGAYGVFTHSRDGEPVQVGQGASLAFGTLLFWKGRHFVSVYAVQESERSSQAVMALGRVVDAAITERGEVPALVGLLPPAGLEERSVVWAQNAHLIDVHARLDARKLLAISAGTSAVLARYSRPEGTAEIVLVQYPDAPTANSAMAAFAAGLLDGGRPRRGEDGWYAAGAGSAAPSIRVFVLRAPSRESAEALLQEATRRLER
jgi:hypothetical protein